MSLEVKMRDATDLEPAPLPAPATPLPVAVTIAPVKLLMPDAAAEV